MQRKMYRITESKIAKALKPLHINRNIQFMSPFKQINLESSQGTDESLKQTLRQAVSLARRNQMKLDKFIRQHLQSNELGEARFNQIKFYIQDISLLSSMGTQRIQKIKTFSSDLVRKLLSKGFTLYQEGVFSNQKFRYFFCNNFIANMVRYSHYNKLNENQLMQMDNHLQQKVFLFLQQRYPQNQSFYSNSRMNNLITLIDNFKTNENDLIYKSKIKFVYKKNGDYTQQIMQFINYLLSVTRQPKLFSNYCQKMKSLFQETDTNDMQKKKEYTKYQIGEKISQGFPYFSEKDLLEQNLKIYDSGIMRILSKWCQQLQQCFDQINIMYKDQRFRMIDGSERYMKQDRRRQLYQLMCIEKQKLIQFVKSAKNNIYENQKKIIQNDKFFTSFRNFSSEDQAITGYFGTIMKKCYQNYLISYLNKLIHCILSAQQNLKNQYDKRMQYKTQINLISFHIGDLYRSRFSSRETQIVALYNRLIKYCSQNKNVLEIIRVKNRLEQSTKDILINFRYDNKIIVELQLIINQENSRFSKCSSLVKHFLYEIRRATFGSVAEICNIYTVVDPRAKFFLKKFQQQNSFSVHKRDSINKKCEHNKLQQTTLPLWCSQCQKFSSCLDMNNKHVFCKECKLNTCSVCIMLQNKEQFIWKNQVDLSFKNLTESISRQFVKKKIKVLNLDKKAGNQIFIYIIYYRSKLMFFENQRNNLFLVGQAKNETQFKNFFLNKHIIKQQERNDKQFQSVEKIVRNLTVKNLIQRTNNKMKKLFIIQAFPLNDEIFVNNKLQSVEKLILNNVKLKSTKNLVSAFKNIKVALLHKNLIQNLDGIQEWTKIQQLSLQSNKLNKIPDNIGKLTYLSNLILTKNQFQQLPEEICSLQNLKSLNIKNNKIRKITKNISKLKNLVYLRLGNNLIDQIPSNINQLQNLQQINISSNNLKYIPEQLKNLVKLKHLTFYQNKINQIPEFFFQKMQNLTKIDFCNNNISKIPSSLQNCKKIMYIDFGKNKLQEIPQFVFKFRKLEYICLQNNQINKININKQNLETVTDLKRVQLNNNKLENIPDQLFQIKSISKLKIGSNPLKLLPKPITKLTQIKQLCIDNLKIKEFPEQIIQLKQLQFLNLANNQLSSIPGSIKNLRRLQNLSLFQNKFQQIPKSLFSLFSLQYLNMGKNSIKSIPLQIKQLKMLKILNLSENKKDLNDEIKKVSSLFNFKIVKEQSEQNLTKEQK